MSAAAANRKRASGPIATARCLVVAASASRRSTLIAAARRQWIDVITVNSAADAYAAVGRGGFGIAVIDADATDAIDLIRHFRAEEATTDAAMLVVGGVGSGETALLLSVGANDVLPAPFTDGALHRRL